MQYERTIRNIGGSLIFTIPADLAKYMKIKAGDALTIQDDKGKKGKFLSAWKSKV